MEKIKLRGTFQISDIIKSNKLVNIIVETGVENVYIPEDCRFILTKTALSQSKNVFCRCETLEKIDMTNFDFSEITTMKWWFYGCEKLKEVNFPKQANLKYLESLCGCFARTAIRSIDLSFIQAKYRPIDFQSTFFYSELKKITLPRCTIHNMAECFAKCANLQEVVAPVSFRYFDDNIFNKTFYNCPNLRKIDFTNSRIAPSVFVNKFNTDFNENNLSDECIIVLP